MRWIAGGVKMRVGSVGLENDAQVAKRAAVASISRSVLTVFELRMRGCVEKPVS